MRDTIYHPHIQHSIEWSSAYDLYGFKVNFSRLLIYLCLMIAVALLLHSNFHLALANSSRWIALPNQDEQRERYLLGDLVWQDADHDGYQDLDEQGIADITVELFNGGLCSGTLVAETRTNVAGLYNFTSLVPGEYCLKFSNIPHHWEVSMPKQIASEQMYDDELDSDGVGTDDKTLAYISNIVLTTDDLNQDLGLYPRTVEIGDRVWLDANGNGMQELEEVGVPDVSVYLLLLDGIIRHREQVTDENGYYLFQDLSPGDYTVQFDLATLPPNHMATEQTLQTGFLTGGVEYLTADMGIYMPVTVAGIVWLDENGNGLQDDGEPEGPEVTVRLYNDLDELIGQTRTLADGSYGFTYLPPDEYYVVFDLDMLLPEQLPTLTDIGLDDTRDSDVCQQGMSGQTELMPLTSSGGVWMLDMGIISLVTEDGRVWLDQNVNGIQDANEAGVADIEVSLLHEDGEPVYLGNDLALTQTDVDGYYRFHNVRPGNYYVAFNLDTLSASHVVTVPNMGSDEGVDSDVNPSTGQTSILHLMSNASSTQSGDMGIYSLSGVRVGGIVWHDINANGVQNVGELGVSDVGVKLFDRDDQPLGQTSTDENGMYLFDGLKSDSYYVRFDLATLPADHHIAISTSDHHYDIHSDADSEEGRTHPTPLLADGMEEMALSMGIYAFSSIGDRVWEDRNGNGLQDPDEPGVADVHINLLDEEENHIHKSTTTDATGHFEFTDIIPGRYQLEFLVDDAFTITRQNVGNDDAIDSDVYPSTGRTAATNLVTGEADPIWDLGIYKSAALGDRVWMDTDGNGIQSEDEAGIAEVKVYLTNIHDSSVISVTSDAEGFYLFEEVPPGEYQLRCDLPDGLVYTLSDPSDIDPVIGGDTFVLSPGTRSLIHDIGLTSPASIGSVVWVDGNGDGSRDHIESGIANMAVNLYKAEGELAQTTKTNIMGAYEFVGLTPGAYTLEFLPPPGFKFTAQLEPDNNGRINSNVSPLTGKTQTILLEPGERVTTVAAGIREEGGDQDVTAIELTHLSAVVVEDGTVLIVWETAAEIETAGFHLYRGTADEEEQAARITDQLILSQGQDGGRYTFRDISALPGVAYRYWLHEVEQDGSAREQGLVNVSIQTEQADDAPDHLIFLPLVVQ